MALMVQMRLSLGHSSLFDPVDRRHALWWTPSPEAVFLQSKLASATDVTPDERYLDKASVRRLVPDGKRWCFQVGGEAFAKDSTAARPHGLSRLIKSLPMTMAYGVIPRLGFVHVGVLRLLDGLGPAFVDGADPVKCLTGAFDCRSACNCRKNLSRGRLVFCTCSSRTAGATWVVVFGRGGRPKARLRETCSETLSA
ncbi:hypothetical protein BR93DRAFT_197606 [Coniochaeta sp. PMI_546]|nr:hypothetical protein BR93DRAFT_197606 [Coniochaeta sp. PMI_546]